MMKIDLDKFNSAYRKSVDSQTMYSPFTPYMKYKKEELIMNKDNAEIIDINSTMEQTKKENDENAKKIRALNAENEKL